MAAFFKPSHFRRVSLALSHYVGWQLCQFGSSGSRCQVKFEGFLGASTSGKQEGKEPRVVKDAGLITVKEERGEERRIRWEELQAAL